MKSSTVKQMLLLDSNMHFPYAPYEIFSNQNTNEWNLTEFFVQNTTPHRLMSPTTKQQYQQTSPTLQTLRNIMNEEKK